MEQAILILIILLVSFLNWVFREGGLRDLMQGRGEPDQTPARPATRPGSRPSRPVTGESEEEERVRRFLEALGLPPDEAAPIPQPQPVAPPPPPPPPPKPVPHTVAQGARSIRDAMERQSNTGNAFMHRRELKPPDPESLLTARELAALERVRADKSTWGTRDPARRRTPVRFQDLLGTPDALRKAIALREILGPPRAFEPEIDLPTLGRK